MDPLVSLRDSTHCVASYPDGVHRCWHRLHYLQASFIQLEHYWVGVRKHTLLKKQWPVTHSDGFAHVVGVRLHTISARPRAVWRWTQHSTVSQSVVIVGGILGHICDNQIFPAASPTSTTWFYCHEVSTDEGNCYFVFSRYYTCCKYENHTGLATNNQLVAITNSDDRLNWHVTDQRLTSKYVRRIDLWITPVGSSDTHEQLVYKMV